MYVAPHSHRLIFKTGGVADLAGLRLNDRILEVCKLAAQGWGVLSTFIPRRDSCLFPTTSTLICMHIYIDTHTHIVYIYIHTYIHAQLLKHSFAIEVWLITRNLTFERLDALNCNTFPSQRRHRQRGYRGEFLINYNYFPLCLSVYLSIYLSVSFFLSFFHSPLSVITYTIPYIYSILHSFFFCSTISSKPAQRYSTLLACMHCFSHDGSSFMDLLRS